MGILFYPVKIAIYYYTDLNYEEILDFIWRQDEMCEKITSHEIIKCPCPVGFFDSEDIKITSDGYFYLQNKIIGKVTIKKKPDYFADGGKILTGGELEITNLKESFICYYDFVIY